MNKKRTSKASEDQKTILVNFMSNNIRFCRNQITDSITNKKLWEELVLKLNATGGAFKTYKQWRKFWSDLKSSVKLKKKKILKKRSQSGATGPSEVDNFPEKLSKIEEFVSASMGSDWLRDDTPDIECELVLGPNPEKYVDNSKPCPSIQNDAVNRTLKQNEERIYSPPPTTTPPPPLQASTSNFIKNVKVSVQNSPPPRKRMKIKQEKLTKILNEERKANKFRERQAIAMERQAKALEDLVATSKLIADALLKNI